MQTHFPASAIPFSKPEKGALSPFDAFHIVALQRLDIRPLRFEGVFVELLGPTLSSIW
jgi:hypothetical protein